MGLSESNKRYIIFKRLACYCCLICDSLDISAKVGLLKWRFSLFKFLWYSDLIQRMLKTLVQNEGQDFKPWIFWIPKFFLYDSGWYECEHTMWAMFNGLMLSILQMMNAPIKNLNNIWKKNTHWICKLKMKLKRNMN